MCKLCTDQFQQFECGKYNFDYINYTNDYKFLNVTTKTRKQLAKDILEKGVEYKHADFYALDFLNEPIVIFKFNRNLIVDVAINIRTLLFITCNKEIVINLELINFIKQQSIVLQSCQQDFIKTILRDITKNTNDMHFNKVLLEEIINIAYNCPFKSINHICKTLPMHHKDDKRPTLNFNLFDKNQFLDGLISIPQNNNIKWTDFISTHILQMIEKLEGNIAIAEVFNPLIVLAMKIHNKLSLK